MTLGTQTDKVKSDFDLPHPNDEDPSKDEEVGSSYFMPSANFSLGNRTKNENEAVLPWNLIPLRQHLNTLLP